MPLQRGHERRNLAPPPPPPPEQQYDGRSSSVVSDDGPASGRRRRQQCCGVTRLGGCHDHQEAAATGGGGCHGHQHLQCRQGQRPSTSDADDEDGEAERGVQRQHEERADEQIQPQAELVVLMNRKRLLQLSIT